MEREGGGNKGNTGESSREADIVPMVRTGIDAPTASVSGVAGASTDTGDAVVCHPMDVCSPVQRVLNRLGGSVVFFVYTCLFVL